MEYDVMDTHDVDDGEPSTAPGSTPAERATPVSLLSSPTYSEMSVPVLAAHCLRELSNDRQGEPCTERYAVELFLRATVQGNQEARAWVHRCFGEVVRDWFGRHPSREAASRLESEEYYVAQAFERFWQATVSPQRLEFSRLAAALQYLRACLHGAILERLRASARLREVSLTEPGEPLVEDSVGSSEVRDILKMRLSNPREQRLAYLLFHCGLSPREIVQRCPQEFRDVQEISRLRRSILEHLLRKGDYLMLCIGEHKNQNAAKNSKTRTPYAKKPHSHRLSMRPGFYDIW